MLMQMTARLTPVSYALLVSDVMDTSFQRSGLCHFQDLDCTSFKLMTVYSGNFFSRTNVNP